ncbi:MarR family winged helix-turn-helix transcriptional regulator [Roseivirga sp.]|uniref:MarR family winged helix-turn-helix transcriptional regulator n=1 Tax=Roseivirga sp. TaxID=1964215 RepID=UPI003B8B393D
MERDIIEELGSLALATRLKNLSERLAKDVSQIYKESELDFEPRWFTLVYALKEGEELAVTELSSMLKQTHPAINQVANVLVANKLVNERKDEADQRKRLLRLSTKGEKLVSHMSDLWGQIKKANDELLDESGGILLESLDKVEEALDNKSMYERIRSFQA